MDDRTDITPEQFEQGVANLLQTVDSGAKWFYWIVGLSLINAVIAAFKGGVSFVIGLNSALIISAAAGEATDATLKGVLFTISLVFIAVFGIIGYLAVKRRHWALLTGFVLYVIDTLFILIMIPGGVDLGLILNAGFHLFALWGIFQAIRANSLLIKLERLVAEAKRETALAGATPGVPPPPYNPIEGQLRNEPPMPKE
ncbi:MAG TPA: hypothetical protein PLZ36_04240 [Armatimonadota bacterium]|nr:hypothetical protein [Armatimonadota bacterium]